MKFQTVLERTSSYWDKYERKETKTQTSGWVTCTEPPEVIERDDQQAKSLKHVNTCHRYYIVTMKCSSDTSLPNRITVPFLLRCIYCLHLPSTLLIRQFLLTSASKLEMIFIYFEALVLKLLSLVQNSSHHSENCNTLVLWYFSDQPALIHRFTVQSRYLRSYNRYQQGFNCCWR